MRCWSSFSLKHSARYKSGDVAADVSHIPGVPQREAIALKGIGTHETAPSDDVDRVALRGKKTSVANDTLSCRGLFDMNIIMKRVFELCIALCLGFIWACVKVDVSVKFPMPPSSQGKLPISLKELKERHAGINRRCPPTLSRDIKGEKQKTAVWCWAASARTVMEYHNKDKVLQGTTVLQCDIVNDVLGLWSGETNCCERNVTPDFIDPPSTCLRGGWPQRVLEKYQFSYEWVGGSFDDWEALKDEVCKVGPFISVIEWSGGGKHTLIVTRYGNDSKSEDPNKVVTIYDPATEDFQDLIFDEFVGGLPDRSSKLDDFSHYLHIVQIKPMAEDRP